MKRTLLSLMAVLLAFSPFHFTAIAEAQEVPTMRWLAQAGEKLFFFQNESKSLSYQVQGDALMHNPQLPVMSYAQRISTSQSSALFLFSNMVYSYTDGEPELLCTLAAYDPSKDLLLCALAANDVLYLLQRTTLYQFSLKTGELLAESSRYSDLCLGLMARYSNGATTWEHVKTSLSPFKAARRQVPPYVRWIRMITPVWPGMRPPGGSIGPRAIPSTGGTVSKLAPCP